MAFPDVTALLVAHLNAAMVLPWAARIPAQRPDELGQVRRIGGAPAPPVRDTARLDVRCWAATEPRAMELALDARAIVWRLAGNDDLGVMCYRIAESVGPRNDTDPETGTPIAWFTVELTVRADDVIHYTPPAVS